MSTVRQEVGRARAYLDIARLRMDGGLDVDVAVAEGVAAVRMPPMMLLPLIDGALAACADGTASKPALRVDLRSEGDRLKVSVDRTSGGSTEADAAALQNIRERLSGLYGAGASLHVAKPKAGHVEVRLDLPLEIGPGMAGEEAHAT